MAFEYTFRTHVQLHSFPTLDALTNHSFGHRQLGGTAIPTTLFCLHRKRFAGLLNLGILPSLGIPVYHPHPVSLADSQHQEVHHTLGLMPICRPSCALNVCLCQTGENTSIQHLISATTILDAPPAMDPTTLIRNTARSTNRLTSRMCTGFTLTTPSDSMNWTPS